MTFPLIRNSWTLFPRSPHPKTSFGPDWKK